MGQAAAQLPSDRVAVLGVIDPDAYTAAAYDTGWIDVEAFGRVQAVIMAGDLGSSATIDAKLQSAETSSGTGVTDVSGGAITQLTQAGTDSNKQAIINCNVDNLPEGDKFVKLIVTVGTATSDMGAILLGFDPRYAPASDSDAATVDEIVSV